MSQGSVSSPGRLPFVRLLIALLLVTPLVASPAAAGAQEAPARARGGAGHDHSTHGHGVEAAAQDPITEVPPSEAGAGGPRELTGVYSVVTSAAPPKPGGNGHGPTKYDHWLELEDGERVLLRLPKHVRETIRPGHRVRARGNPAANGSLDVTEAEPVSAVQGVPTTGSLSVLVILTHWGSTGPDSVTPTGAQQQVGVDDAGWFSENSYGATTLRADATPWLQLPSDTTCSAYYTLYDRAVAAATAAGYTPSSYNHVMIYFPTNACGWAGLGEVNGRITWIAGGFMDRRVTVHELGHNLGLWHANSLSCRDADGVGVVLSGNCTESEYGDHFDAMGMDDRHFNSWEKNTLGWVPGGPLVITGDASVTVAPLQATSGTRAVMVRPPQGPEYWLDFRRSSGYDTGLPTGATNGVQVHMHANSQVHGTELLDHRPDTYGNVWDSVLTAGSSWRTPEGVTIAVDSVDDAGASVRVLFGDDVTVPDVPTSFTYTKSDSTSSASITWAPPASDGGSAITGYRVARTAWGSQAAWSTTVGADVRAQTFTKLLPGGTYTLSVQAITAAGTGPAASGSVTMPNTGLPGVPTSFTYTKSDSSSSARISWKPPTSTGGSAITGYRVTRTAWGSQAAWSTTVGASVRAQTFTKLLPGGTYTLSVQAITAKGTGPAASGSVTMALKVPGKPIIGTASAGASGSPITATARWSPPTSDGGSGITGYRITALRMSSRGSVLGTTVSPVVDPSLRSYVMQLPRTGNYRFSLQAINAIGASARSARSNLVAGR